MCHVRKEIDASGRAEQSRDRTQSTLGHEFLAAKYYIHNIYYKNYIYYYIYNDRLCALIHILVCVCVCFMWSSRVPFSVLKTKKNEI